jgi:hypothetical protein
MKRTARRIGHAWADRSGLFVEAPDCRCRNHRAIHHPPLPRTLYPLTLAEQAPDSRRPTQSRDRVLSSACSPSLITLRTWLHRWEHAGLRRAGSLPPLVPYPGDDVPGWDLRMSWRPVAASAGGDPCRSSVRRCARCGCRVARQDDGACATRPLRRVLAMDRCLRRVGCRVCGVRAGRQDRRAAEYGEAVVPASG